MCHAVDHDRLAYFHDHIVPFVACKKAPITSWGWHSSFLLVKSKFSESRNEMAKCRYGTIEMKNVKMNDHRNEISMIF